MGDPLRPDPRSPEGQMIAYAIDKGYLKRLDLEEARIKLSGHPAGREPGALLRLLRARYLDPDHLEELRRYYQRTKAEIVRAAEEAQLEVLSISDILVGPPFSISDTGEVEVHPLQASSDDSGALSPESTRGSERAPEPRDEGRRPAPPRPADDPAPASGGLRWAIPAAVLLVIALAGVAAWLSAG